MSVVLLLPLIAGVASAPPAPEFSDAIAQFRAGHASISPVEVRGSYLLRSDDPSLDSELADLAEIVPERRVWRDPLTQQMFVSLHHLEYFISHDSLRLQTRWVVTAGVLDRRTAVECWTPAETWRARAAGGSDPEVNRIEPKPYEAILDARSRNISPWEESRAKAGEYIELARFLLWIIENDNSVEVEPIEAGIASRIRVPDWNLEASVDARTGELQSIEWASPDRARKNAYRFEGRHPTRLLPARYPQRARVTLSVKTPGHSSESSAVILYDEPIPRPGLDASVFDWRATRPRAVLAANGRIETAGGELLPGDEGLRKPPLFEPRDAAADPLADLKPSRSLGVWSRALIAASAALLIVGAVVLVRANRA